jgi:lipopolysaccharide export system permease protein
VGPHCGCIISFNVYQKTTWQKKQLMKIIQYFLWKSMLFHILFVLVVLSFLFMMITFISETDKLTKFYTVFDAFVFVLWSSPKKIIDLAPVAVLIGTLTSLGAMASNNELTVIRAAGFSIGQITMNVFIVGIFLIFIVLIAGEFVVPICENAANKIKNPKVLSNFKNGLWFKNKQIFIQVGKVNPDKSLSDITIYNRQGYKVTKKIKAKKAYEINKNIWNLQDVQIKSYQKDKVLIKNLPSQQFYNLLKSDIFKVLILKADRLPIGKLLTYINYLKTNKLKYQSYQLALWQKILSPFALLIMQSIALLFIFGVQRVSNTGLRIVFGVIIGITYSMAVYIMNNLALVYGINPLLSVLLPLIIFASISFIANKKYVFNN